MVVTKFDDNEDWGDSATIDYFNDGKTLTDLKCKADDELPILKKKTEQEKHKKDLSKPKQNNHAHKKSLKRIEKFRKMQNEKTITMKQKAERNKYSTKKKAEEDNDDAQEKSNEINSNKRKLDETPTAPLKKMKTNSDNKSKDVEITSDNKSTVSKKKKKKKPRNNKFKPKEGQLSQKDKLANDVKTIKSVEKPVKNEEKIKERKENNGKQVKKTIAVKVLDDDNIDEDLAKQAARKLKNKMKKLKRKEEAVKERESKIIHGEFLERNPLKNIGNTYEDVDYEESDGNDCSDEKKTKEAGEVQVGNTRLDAKKLKKMVSDSKINSHEEEEESVSKKKKKKKKDEKKLSLKERMEERLDAAHFRHLNEQLYTQSGEQSLQMFVEQPTAYEAYHRGYSSQVEEWPLNPVDKAIAFIRKKRKDCLVADLGCGDAKIAASVNNVVYSYDLVAANSRVQTCNISQVPLLAKNVDIAVFCLSLMGTDFVSYLVEANRILRIGGTLIIAEVVSRFEDVATFVRQLEKLGFTLKKKDESNKMFIWFEFLKVKDTPSGKSPDIVLNPCKYKKR